MAQFFDELETRSFEERTEELNKLLPIVIAKAQSETPYYGNTLSKIDARDIDEVEKLQNLPLVRKSDLIELQRVQPPFGGLNTRPANEMGRVFQSPGPIYEVHGRCYDATRVARALFACGMRSKDLVFNTYSYHLTPAGLMSDEGAKALGCAVFPAGPTQTELQVQALAALRPTGYIGTPSFLNILLDRAASLKLDVSSLSHASVGAEPLPYSLRESFRARGIDAYQAYGTAELGLVAYETEALEGMVVTEGVIVEVVRPGTNEVVQDGEVGELVVTVLDPDYPMIRFATGDLTAVLKGRCPTGRTNRRIKGWMGRADQTTKVRGMFVHPQQVHAILQIHPEISRARLCVTNENYRDELVLRCEVAPDGTQSGAAIEATLKNVCKLRGNVEIVDIGDLPNDGKIIDDLRDFR